MGPVSRPGVNNYLRGVVEGLVEVVGRRFRGLECTRGNGVVRFGDRFAVVRGAASTPQAAVFRTSYHREFRRAAQRLEEVVRQHRRVDGLVWRCWSGTVLLTEALAADFLLTALALASFRGGRFTSRALGTIGACLGLALMLRVHFAPAVAIIGLAACGASWRTLPRLHSLTWVCAGSAVPIVAFGIADWIAWGVPFHARPGPATFGTGLHICTDVKQEFLVSHQNIMDGSRVDGSMLWGVAGHRWAR